MTFQVYQDADGSTREPILEPNLPIIDAHHHLWPRGAGIAYDIGHFQKDLATGHNIIATVFVECMAGFRPDGDAALRPVGETEFVVAETGLRSGGEGVGAAIIGWADLGDPQLAARTLDAHIHAGGGRFRGVRHNVVWHNCPELVGPRKFPEGLLLDEGFRSGLREVQRRSLTYDVWLFHEQLDELAATADALPDLTFIVNHFGGPVMQYASFDQRGEIFRQWRESLARVAARPNVYLKLGGLGMPVYGLGFDSLGHRPSSVELGAAWAPYIDAAIALFGVARCMFETNFPVDKQSFSYDAVWNGFKIATQAYSPDERAALFHGTAQRVYRIASG